jgi:hypothetical protein
MTGQDTQGEIQSGQGECCCEWGFDLTEFENKRHFRELLDRHGLDQYKRLLKAEGTEYEAFRYMWTTENGKLSIVTGNNPISGFYSRPGDRQRETGYASYIGITGDDDAVRELAGDIRESATFIKGESPCRRDYI